MDDSPVHFLRYPGGKQRILDFLLRYLPNRSAITGRFVEPFVGGGAIFFALNPRTALLADANRELIDLYRGIRLYPTKVWETYRRFPSSKSGYYDVRGLKPEDLSLKRKAARLLYLNRTCFKGMWRHNARGQFNVGYGGQDRRWAVGKNCLNTISRRLKRARLWCCDFEQTINQCKPGDYLFLDPPYRPGEKGMPVHHYELSCFDYADHERLAKALRRITKRGIQWAMTTTSHPEILSFFPKLNVIALPQGTGGKPGLLAKNTGEVLIRNHEDAP
jgi:DNA adenine methylase